VLVAGAVLGKGEGETRAGLLVMRYRCSYSQDGETYEEDAVGNGGGRSLYASFSFCNLQMATNKKITLYGTASESQ
jgi:hypothetical protein